MTHSDAAQRSRALEPDRSFIVQAPAGSGKTELLIQRYLRLLATVEEPEQIVAITFTRKAAAEMRSRVARAFANAAADAAEVAPHQRTTLELARAALEVAAQRGWMLRQHPERLRIETLDALNASLAQRLPLLSGGVAGAQIVEDATPIYRSAAQRAVAALATSREGSVDLGRILPTVDYRIDRLERMTADLLAKREQWIAAVAGSLSESAEPHAQSQLAALAQQRLTEIEKLTSAEERAALRRLVEAAGAQSAGREPARAAPSDSLLAPWRSIVELLLTKSGAWRRRWTRSHGVGSGDTAARDELEQLSRTLQARPGLLESLVALHELPPATPGRLDAAMLASVRGLLLRAVAELRVEFSVRRCVDFSELALAAQLALGRVDQPSDLLLAIDRRIHHILVDEFQDTSKTQLRLLELLTAGWEPNDGRTLFLVGDPMQSIYRFRNADMSLFLRAQRAGVGAVRCEPLLLSANFRAAPALVEWVNKTFERLLPSQDDIEIGSARFHPSQPMRVSCANSGATYHLLRSSDLSDEIDAIIRVVERERSLSLTQSIAVLVQSRTHLVGLKRRLQARGWLARAIEIDALNIEPFVQDLLGLCRALTHFADRPAWLAVLRAPWCGLTWSDLERLTRNASETTVWDLMHDEPRLDSLSADGRDRLIALRGHLETAFAGRGDERFVAWIEHTWRALGGPLVHDVPDDRVTQFFAVLANAGRDQDVVDPVELESFFAAPQRQPDESSEGMIEIMTIHRAKGLEFDTVVVSGLNRTMRRDDRQLLHWHETTTSDGDSLSLVVPLTAEGSELYDYVRKLESRRAEAERTRLLYVATTRARSRLHLIAGIEGDRPTPGSLLSYLWPDVELAPAEAAAKRPTMPRYVEPKLRRLRTPPVAPTAGRPPTTSMLSELVEYEWVGAAAAPIGIVAHRYLQQIADDGLDAWHAKRVEACVPEIGAELELLGVERAVLNAAAARVATALRRVLDDPTGRWILGPHDQASSELTLSRIIDGAIVFVRLDRTFVEDGVRWIVDYKSGSHEGGEVDAFLRSEVERYRPQLEEYAQAIRALDDRPIRIGLYFPMMQSFRDWSPGADL